MEIVEKEVKLDELLDEFVEGRPTLKDWRYVLYILKHPFRVKGVQKFLKQNPSNYKLCYLIGHGVKPLKEYLAEMLLNRDPNNDGLRLIIYQIDTPSIREKAGVMILEQNPTIDDVEFVKLHVEALKEKAEKMLEDLKARGKRVKQEIIKDMELLIEKN